MVLATCTCLVAKQLLVAASMPLTYTVLAVYCFGSLLLWQPTAMFGSTRLYCFGSETTNRHSRDGDALRVTQWQYDPLRYGLAMFHSETTIVAISVVWSDVRIGLSAVWLVLFNRSELHAQINFRVKLDFCQLILAMVPVYAAVHNLMT